MHPVCFVQLVIAASDELIYWCSQYIVPVSICWYCIAFSIESFDVYKCMYRNIIMKNLDFFWNWENNRQKLWFEMNMSNVIFRVLREFCKVVLGQIHVKCWQSYLIARVKRKFVLLNMCFSLDVAQNMKIYRYRSVFRIYWCRFPFAAAEKLGSLVPVL